MSQRRVRKPFVPNVKARELMDESQIEEFKEAFRVFDTDHGGTIDSEEYGKLMSMLGMSSDVERLTEMFVAMDGDEDGELQFEEFLVLMATLMHQESTTDELLDAFETIDSEGTGYIPLSLVQHLLEGIAENVSYSEVDLLLAEIDSDSDGMVNMQDLQRFLSLERLPHRVKIVSSNQHHKQLMAKKTSGGRGGVEI
jgi:calmodulin